MLLSPGFFTTPTKGASVKKTLVRIILVAGALCLPMSAPTAQADGGRPPPLCLAANHCLPIRETAKELLLNWKMGHASVMPN